MAKKIFVSYWHQQIGYAHKIKADLEKKGYEVWLDKANLRHTIIWTQDLTEAIIKNDCVLLLWSSEAQRSDNVHKEIITARALLKPIIPFLIEDETAFPALPKEISFLQAIARDTYEQSFDDLLKRLSDDELNKIQYPTLHEKLYVPKDRNQYFVGRQADLVNLFVDLCGFMGVKARKNPCSITGLPGIGKSELAIEFAYRFSVLFPNGIFWIDADKEDLSSEFIKLAPYLKMQAYAEEPKHDFAKRILHQLANLPESLLILDGLTSLRAFNEWCPTGGQSCAVMITTRLLLQEGRIKLLQLKELDEISAFQLLCSRRMDILRKPEEAKAAKKICKLIGNYPLALELFASHLAAEPTLSPQDFLNEIEKAPPLSREAQAETAQYTVIEAKENLFSFFNLIYTKLNREQIDPYFFLISWFSVETTVKSEFIEEAFGKAAAARQALRQLRQFSLLAYDVNKRIILHPLVVTFARVLQNDEEKKNYQSQFVKIVSNFMRTHNEIKHIDQVLPEASHIEFAIQTARDNGLLSELRMLYAEYAKYLEYRCDFDQQLGCLDKCLTLYEQEVPKDFAQIADLNNRVGAVLKMKGDYKNARLRFQNALNLYEQKFGPEHPEVANTLDHLAGIYQELGEFSQALKQYQRAHAINAKHYLEDAPQMTSILQDIARTQFQMGEYQRAKSEFERILKLKQNNKALGYSELDIASCYADLCELDIKGARYKNALNNWRHSARILTKTVGKEHLEMAKAYERLGRIFVEQAKYNRALFCFQKALAICKSFFAESHPAIAELLTLMSHVHRRKGDFGKAFEYITDAIQIKKEIYGEQHPSVAEALEVLIKIYYHKYDFEASKPILEQALRIREAAYGKDHPLVGNTLHDFGSYHLRKGEYDLAISYFERALVISRKALGERHPEYIERSINLGIGYYQKGSYQKALQQFEQTLPLIERVFEGNPHPLTARLLLGLSEVYRRLGNFTKAFEYVEESLRMKTKSYGASHPSVADALEVLLKIYYHQYNFEAARPVLDRTLRIRKAAYNEHHPLVGNSLHDFGSYHLRKGEYDLAISYFEQALAISRNVFGEKHPEYIERSINLANGYWQRGDYRKTLEQLEKTQPLVDGYFEGGPHPLSARLLLGFGETYRRLGNFERALDCLEKSIRMKEQIYGNFHPSVADALEVLVKIYYHKYDFEAAKPVLERALRIRKNAYGEQHPLVGNSFHDFGSYHLRQGEYGLAINYFKDSLAICEKAFGENHPEYIERSINLANGYWQKGDYREALTQLEKTQPLVDNFFQDRPHPLSARLLLGFSETQRRLGNFEKALEYTDASIKMKEKIYSVSHPSVADALEVLVKVYYHKCNFKDAEPVLQRALQIREAAYGKNHPLVGNSLHDFGSYHLRKGEYKKALEYFRRALEINHAVFGDHHPDSIDRMVTLASAYRLSGNNNEALEFLKKAEEHMKLFFKESKHPLEARALLEMSHVHRKRGKFDEARAYVEKSITMKEELYGSSHPSLAESLQAKAKLQIHNYEYRAAEELLESSLRMRIKAYGRQHPEVANGLNEQGCLLTVQGRYTEALKNHNEAYEIKRNYYGESHPELGKLLMDIGIAYRHLQESAEAMNYLQLAYNNDSQFLEPNHPYLAKILMEMGVTLAQQKSHLSGIDKLKTSLGIYEKNKNQDIHEWAQTLDSLAEIYIETGFPDTALDYLAKALEKKRLIFLDDHPELAKTFYLEGRAYSLQKKRVEAKRKLEEAMHICNRAFITESAFGKVVHQELKNLQSA